MFQPPRDRDAYASIRGYVYQIDSTVDQWLALCTGQVLELERGEDIDLVGQFISADGSAATESRLLEQVKHREAGITLRTAAALEALANFHDHRVHDTRTDLRFRFLTNAVIASEQFNPFPNRVPGITLWELVRTGQLDEVDLQAAAGHLCRFLANSLRPDGLNEAVWATWKSYIENETPGAFREFIDRLEWSTSQPDAMQLPVVVCSRILSLRFATVEAEAQAIADRLFVHVARLLSTAGIKRLTVEDRDSVVIAPAVPAADRELLAQLRSVIAGHGNRLDQLEADVSALGGRVETIFLSVASTERVELSLPAPDLSLPLPVTRLCSRRQSAEFLGGLLGTSGWLALRGGPDTGKSQLAIQVALTHGGCRAWVRFHHFLSSAEAARVLDRALTALAGRDVWAERTELVVESLASLGSGILLVLDDVPRLTADDPFTERLTRFGMAARTAQVHVISTSQFEFPARVRGQFADGWLKDQPSPPFDNGEAGELFRAHGAPDSFLSEQRLHFLNRQAAGHPLLLTATAEFLAGRAWKYREEEIEALLRGDHTEPIIPEVIDRLTRTLSDPSRELLYRLTLPLGSFAQSDITAVASVTPAVDRPRERFNQLLGAWIQRDTDTLFEVSPLVKPLGRSEIAVDVRTQCYRELAEVITRHRVMNPLACERAIYYNLKAREPGRAITLYVIFLIEVLKTNRPEHITPFMDKWREAPLPADLSVGNRLFVRAYQLAVFIEYGLNTRFVVEDIDALLSQATVADGWGIVALAVQNLGKFRSKDPGRMMQYVRRAVELPTVFGPDGREIVFDEISIPDMLWMLVTDLRTPSLLGQWLDTVAALPESQQDRFWNSNLGRQGVWLVANRIYMTEWEKPPTDQDWASLLRTLGEFRTRTQWMRQPRLEAALTGVMLEILGDRKWLDQAADVAEGALSRWPDDPDVQFEVRGTLGRQYAYQQRPDLALPLLDAALSQPHNANDHERLRCLLAASINVGPHDLRYAEQARDLARTSTLAPDIEVARALGEHALSVLQSQGGQAGAIAACPTWSEAMRRFFGVRGKDMIWRNLFPLFAHATSYLAGMARDGCPPERAVDGGVFVVPSRGFLMKDYMPEGEALYREAGMAAVAWLMQSYASTASERSDADHWMRFAIDESRRIGASFIQAATGIDAAAVMLASGKIEDAVEMGVFAGRGMVVHRAVAAQGNGNFEGMGVDVAAAYRALPEDQRQLGDRFAVISGLVPAAMALVRCSLTDPTAAASTAGRVAGFCRELAADESGDRELWQTGAELFELSTVVHANAGTITSRVRMIDGDGERELTLRILGYILATGHASPEEAMSYQLGMIEALLRWYSAREGVNHLVLTPYIESYWRHAAQNCRFAFRAPGLTIAGIESALDAPEAERLYAVLSAAANGFQIRGAREVLQRLREMTYGFSAAR